MKRSKLLKIIISVLIVVLAAAGVGIYWMQKIDSSPELSAPKTGGLSGIVVDGMTGTPLSGASVMARRVNAPANAPREGVICNERGRFVLQLENDVWHVMPSVDGYVLKGRNDSGREIDVSDGTQFVNAKLSLWPEAGLRGRIVTGDVGIQAEIELAYDYDASEAENYTFKTLTTDENGVFFIDGAYGGMTTLMAAAEGFANVTLKDVELSFGQIVDLGDIPMRDGVSLFGRVTDLVSQEAVAGADVSIRNANGEPLESVVTGLNGHYRLPPLDMGQVTVDINADGYHPISRRLKLSGNANHEMNIVLKRSWGLTLDIQNMTGREPIKTHIKITDVTSDEEVYAQILPNGKIALEDIKGGPYLVQAESYDKMTSQTIRVTAGDNARIVLKPFARIEGTARKSDGSPLTQGEYRYGFRPEQTAEESLTPWYALASSEFEIPDLPEGRYRVEIRHGADEPVSSPVFQLRHGDVRHVTIQLTEGGVLKGHVVTTESGFAVRSAEINIDGTNLTAKTDRDGYFTIDKLPNRPFTVIIKPDRNSELIKFEGIVVKDNTTVEREFHVVSEWTEQRERRRQEMEERRARGEIPPRPPGGRGRPRPMNEDGTPMTPPWGDGPPPWGDGPPPWANGNHHSEQPLFEAPPNMIGDQPELPMNEDGTFVTPPWEEGKPPWGDGPPPWEVNGGNDVPPETPQNMPEAGDKH